MFKVEFAIPSLEWLKASRQSRSGSLPFESRHTLVLSAVITQITPLRFVPVALGFGDTVHLAVKLKGPISVDATGAARGVLIGSTHATLATVDAATHDTTPAGFAAMGLRQSSLRRGDRMSFRPVEDVFGLGWEAKCLQYAGHDATRRLRVDTLLTYVRMSRFATYSMLTPSKPVLERLEELFTARFFFNFVKIYLEDNKYNLTTEYITSNSSNTIDLNSVCVLVYVCDY